MNADMIIVGAGAAGAVLAARLSALGDRTILLIEAGPDPTKNDPSALPDDVRDGTRNATAIYDWGYWNRAHQTGALLHYPRGRIVGGSSSVNTCIALRGQPRDYDEWGLPDWTWDRCLPAFKRLENDLDFPEGTDGSDWHGSDGPIPIRRHTPEELAPWQAAFIEGCKGLGFEECEDHNAPGTEGVGPHAMNKIDGERMSASRCYLTPAVRKRDTLNILANSLVRRVVFEGNRAIGVEVESGGPGNRTIEIHHANTVVLCAGAIATPGILLRSGVGPRSELERLGAPVIAEVAAVGARLLDHPGAAMFLRPRPGVCKVTDPLIQTTLRYTARTSTFKGEMQLQPGSLVPLPIGEVPVLSIMTSVGKPRGYGRLRFPSLDPHAKPTIDSDFLSEPDNLEKLCEAMELGWLCATSPEMRDLATCWAPGEGAFSSRRQLREWIPYQCGSGYHPCGTVPMGADDNAEAATDPRGRVRKTRGLFVADASLFPTIPSANTHLPTLMLGERFARWFEEGLDA